MKKLVLFDIDGTLIRSGKTPRESITEAIEETFGTKCKLGELPFSGKTDPQIVWESLESCVPEADLRAGLDSALARYLERLDARLRPEDMIILPGVEDVLSELCARRDEFCVGLLTGNVARGARIKMDRSGLLRFFDPPWLGAFGSDSMNRHDLPAVAVRRAEEEIGRIFEAKDIVIIGDSPYDMTCGSSLNVKTIGVATGWHSRDELESYSPDHCFMSLADLQTVVEAIAA